MREAKSEVSLLLAKLEGRDDAKARFLRLQLSLNLSENQLKDIHSEIDNLPQSQTISPQPFQVLKTALEDRLQEAISYSEYEKLKSADGTLPEEWSILLKQLRPGVVSPLPLPKQSSFLAKERERCDLLLDLLVHRARLKRRGKNPGSPVELLTAMQRKTNDPLKRLLQKLIKEGEVGGPAPPSVDS